MTFDAAKLSRLDELLLALADDALSQSQAAELEQLVLDYPAARLHYLRVTNLNTALRWMAESTSGQWSVASGQSEQRGERREEWESGTIVAREEWRVENERQTTKTQDLSPKTEILNPQIPHFSLPSPLSSLPSAWAFSYSVATVFLALALLGAWFVTITHPDAEALANNSRNASPSGNAARDPSDFTFVGHVSGLADCRWSDPATETYSGAGVTIGRRYALKSGLMEITYDSGIKVILQGPCDYKVESPNSGYLQVGKLVARVGAGDGGRGTGEDSAKPQAAVAPSENPKSQIPNPKSLSPLSPLPSPLFAVRTPTALVEDLGTEFGVEVSESGETASHVFQGRVVMRSEGGREKGEGRVTDGNKSNIQHPTSEILLSAGQSARVEHDSAGDRAVVRRENIPSAAFVRALPRPTPRFIDLADIVAGGDGFGRAKQRGIDAVTGHIILNPAQKYNFEGDHAYHRVEDLPFIDGVFVPDGGHGPVQLDSSGHRTTLLTDTENRSWHFLWSGQIPGDPARTPTPRPPVSCWLGEVNYAWRGHSVLCIPPNKGVTFDLEAMRRANPGLAIVRFTATAGNTEDRSEKPWAEHVSADLWVFLDGELRFSKTNINFMDGAFAIDLQLKPESRFLTLVATDGGNGTHFDWTIFGDPRLELKPTNKVRDTHQDSASAAPSVNREEGPPMKQ